MQITERGLHFSYKRYYLFSSFFSKKMSSNWYFLWHALVLVQLLLMKEAKTYWPGSIWNRLDESLHSKVERLPGMLLVFTVGIPMKKRSTLRQFISFCFCGILNILSFLTSTSIARNPFPKTLYLSVDFFSGLLGRSYSRV